jgi:hypothetical protein
MPEEQTPKPIDPSKLSIINQLIYQLSLILLDLLSAGRATADPTELMQINNEYMAVGTILNQAAQAQAAANDTLFNQVTSTLKTQAKMLEDMETQIKKIVSDVQLAGRVTGYIAEGITLLIKL